MPGFPGLESEALANQTNKSMVLFYYCFLRKVCLFKSFYLFVHLFLAVLGLSCSAWLFLAVLHRGRFSRGEWSSRCGGFSCGRDRVLGAQASALAAKGLKSCGVQA